MPAQNFRSVIAGEPHGSNVANQTVDIQFGRSRHIHCAIGNPNSLFCQLREVSKKFVADRYRLMRLMANSCDLARDADIRTIAIGTVKSVARKLSRIWPRPSHDHAAIETAGKRHGKWSAAIT